MTVVITLTTAGTNTGPFNLYSNVDGFISAFATGISKSALLAGYTSTAVPNNTTVVRALSTGTDCNGSYVDMPISGLPSYYTYLISGTTQLNNADACENLTTPDTVYSLQADSPIVENFWTNSLCTIPFSGNGNYYKYRLQSSSTFYSARISGTAPLTNIAPC
jgi:hypothetical protein